MCLQDVSCVRICLEQVDITQYHYYLGFFANRADSNEDKKISVILTTYEEQEVQYSIEAPGVGYYHSGSISAGDEVTLNLSVNVEVLSHDQHKGIYLTTTSDNVTVIGQNLDIYSSTSDTFFALPIMDLINIYVHYGISVPRAPRYNSSILIVGTENNTMMKLTATQSVSISIGTAVIHLIAGRQYSFVVNRLQTVYIGSVDDLSGTKIVTDRPVSVFSGHECANVPWNVSLCSYLIEQIPPVALWGQVHYTAPLTGKRSYTIKVLAAYNSTTVNIYCNNSMKLHTINEGEFFNKTLQMKEHCTIHSNKKVLVVQISHGGDEDRGHGDPMMTLVPATSHYLNKFDFVTANNPLEPDYNHHVNIIVMAQYYHPNMIYLISGGVNRSLATQQWVPIQVNSITEAYATQMRIPEGVNQIFHTNATAQMMIIVYGFSFNDGYGHIGGINNHIGRTQGSTGTGH